MIFRQFYHQDSGTYTYLLGGRAGGEALIIDPVEERVGRYLTLLDELDLTLAKVLDTHVHADHISGMAELRDRTRCVTVMGRESPVDVVSMRVSDGDLKTTGRGTSTDIIEASARAYVDAINRLELRRGRQVRLDQQAPDRAH